jgi:hypothetical protein
VNVLRIIGDSGTILITTFISRDMLKAGTDFAMKKLARFMNT